MNTTKQMWAALAAAVIVPCVSGQDLIDPMQQYSWGENIGFMNWRDAGDGAQSVRVHDTFLSGTIWCENVGHVDLGDGPANDVTYANLDGTDAGVNIATGGALSGFAWGENVGWINFAGGSLATPPQPARIDTTQRRFFGYAWGENIGWINLNDASVYVGIVCLCETDGNVAQVDVFDLLQYLSGWFLDNPVADVDGAYGVDVFDLLVYLDCWFPASEGATCP